ncbi:MAG: nitroreductase family protein [Solobacterium sp.]|nr:nitroreductase family protein [Solobacterium sp.]
MALIDIIRSRRAIRKYREEQITEEELNLILEAGTFAPSAGGGQRAMIVAVQDRELAKKIGRINASLMKRPNVGHVSADQPSIIDDPTILNGFYDAPTVCVIFNKGQSQYSISDSFCVAENMILEAYDLGVASAIIGRAEMTFDNDFGRDLMKTWEIPEDYTARAFVILGYIDGEYPAVKPRKEGRVRIVR